MVSEKYIRLMYELVKEKDYFVVTTNGEDHFIPAGFVPPSRDTYTVLQMLAALTEKVPND